MHSVKIKIGALCFLLSLSFIVNAQFSENTETDTLPIYSLEEALQKDVLKVYKISLRKNRLTYVPEEIYQFKNLISLNLSRNKLRKFPIKITELKKLQVLDISSNDITEIPKEIGLLTNLKRLYVNQNDITAIPTEIRFLKKLKLLDLWGNNIESLPYEISELENTLEEIDMRVILMSNKEHKKIKELLPNTKIKFSKSCNCDF